MFKTRGLADPKLVKLAYLHDIYTVIAYVFKDVKIVKVLDPNAKIIMISDHGDLVECGTHYYGLFIHV